MLELAAIQYVNQTEESLRLIAIGINIFGAVLAGLTYRGSSELRRSPYFALSCLLVLAKAVSQFVWVATISAMLGGYLWTCMLVDVLVGVAVGYGFGVIAIARSRDAFGHGRGAALAFIPFANFWLLLTPSKNEISANRTPTIPLLTDGSGVLTGFVMLIAGIAIASFIEIEAEGRVLEAQSDPAFQQMGIKNLIGLRGLEQAIKEIALGVPTPSPVDEYTTIIKVEGDGTTLLYTYEVAFDLAEIPSSLRESVVAQNCHYMVMRPVIEAGGALQHVYLGLDGSQIGTIEVNSSICGL